MCDPTFNCEEKVVAKVEPIIKVVIRYFDAFVKSCYMYLKGRCKQR